MSKYFYTDDLEPWNVTFLEYEAIIVTGVYCIILVGVLDTMRVHRLFRKGEEKKGFNVYLFYLLSILICVSRIFSNIFFFKLLKKNDWNLT